MIFKFQVDIEVTRDEGRFASRDEISGMILEAIADANPDTLEGESGGQYTVSMWEPIEVER